ncbi:mechanosensitive ion channel family protein [Halomarina oriensis]|uniref:Mechanosensitive ion channel n=1 Tax=Halomarina oriensis TaxID=671145 RepID=A0A6B0GEN0_9EURY|nr:mechanosensitive ion channel family protein [Halomarina oriensis]MWG33174.1 mechanosensitive ion channel [Halomarina oriensis]
MSSWLAQQGTETGDGSGTETPEVPDFQPDEVGPVGRALREWGVPRGYAEPLGAVFTFVVLFVVFYGLIRVVVVPLADRALAARGLKRNARKPLVRLTRGVSLVVAVSLAFSLAGYGGLLSSLTTIGAAATLAVGFALRDLLSNFVAGVFIYADRPFRIGDWIEWPETGGLPNAGVVTDITFRVTRVQTFDNQLLTIPNSKLTNDVVMNPTARDKLRVSFEFGIGYEDDIDRATDIILAEAERHPDVLDLPDPIVTLSENPLADSYVGLVARFWIENPNRGKFLRVRSEFVKAVKERFDEEGIDIPYPQVDLSGTVETHDPNRR